MSADTQISRIAAIAVGEDTFRVFSMSGRQRLAATLERLEVQLYAPVDLDPAIGDVMVINVSYVLEERLLADFVQTRQSVLTARDLSGKKIIAVAICPAEERDVWIERVGNETPIETLADLNGVSLYEAEELSGAYNRRLRKKEAPILLKATPEKER